MKILVNSDYSDGYVRTSWPIYSPHHEEEFKEWNKGGRLSWNRVFVVHTEVEPSCYNRMIIFKSNLIERIYAWIMSTFLGSDYFANQLTNMGAVQKSHIGILTVKRVIFDEPPSAVVRMLSNSSDKDMKDSMRHFNNLICPPDQLLKEPNFPFAKALIALNRPDKNLIVFLDVLKAALTNLPKNGDEKAKVSFLNTVRELCDTNSPLKDTLTAAALWAEAAHFPEYKDFCLQKL